MAATTKVAVLAVSPALVAKLPLDAPGGAVDCTKDDAWTDDVIDCDSRTELGVVACVIRLFSTRAGDGPVPGWTAMTADRASDVANKRRDVVPVQPICGMVIRDVLTAAAVASAVINSNS